MRRFFYENVCEMSLKNCEISNGICKKTGHYHPIQEIMTLFIFVYNFTEGLILL